MAYKEYYVGTTGPFLIDEADPLVAVPNQIATKQDVSDGIVVASDSVESETSFGLTPSAGASADFSRSDHTHGTPTAPSSGVAGGQTSNGGTAASETLTLSSTAHATKGKILFGTSAYDEVNNRLGIGTASPNVNIGFADGGISDYVNANNKGVSIGVNAATNNNVLTAIQNLAGDFSQLSVFRPGGALNGGDFQYYTLGPNYASSGLVANRSVFMWSREDFTNGIRIGAITGPVIFFNGGAASSNERMRIADNGNVGINTTTPNAKLEVKGAGTTTGVNFQLLDSADAVKFTVLDNGAISAVNQITSSLATGTSPFAVTSTTKNTNLNADLWDGLHSTDVPNIKQNISLTAQVAAIGTTAITGTNTAGLYRVSYSLLDTTADITAGTIMVNFTGTDEAGAFTMSSVALPLTALGRTQGTFFLRILGTGSVSYSTTLVGIIGTSQYGLFISAEKIL